MNEPNFERVILPAFSSSCGKLKSVSQTKDLYMSVGVMKNEKIKMNDLHDPHTL